jgi:hypothetical protein
MSVLREGVADLCNKEEKCKDVRSQYCRRLCCLITIHCFSVTRRLGLQKLSRTQHFRGYFLDSAVTGGRYKVWSYRDFPEERRVSTNVSDNQDISRTQLQEMDNIQELEEIQHPFDQLFTYNEKYLHCEWHTMELMVQTYNITRTSPVPHKKR